MARRVSFPIAFLVFHACFWSACGSGGVSAPPNVIMIVMDTTRADRCSVNGYGRPTTRSLEAVAREGMNFRNTWSPAGWTGPAHASLFTGLLPERHGFRRRNRTYLDPNATTVAEVLKQAGYRTACLSNNPTVAPGCGLTQGFDAYRPLFVDLAAAYPTAPATNRIALEWLKGIRARGERFFLFINHMEAHFPYTPPAEFREQFRRPEITPAEMGRVSAFGREVLGDHNFGLGRITPGDLRIMSDLYDAEIACLDEAIGRFVAQVRDAGILDETLLIITADHGENLGEHGLVDHMFSLHRTIRHVPLVVRLPGGRRAGEVIDGVVRLEDLFPTVLQVCGLPVPPGLDGRSILGDLGVRRARATLDAPVEFLLHSQREKGLSFDVAPLMVDYQAVFDGRLHWIQDSKGTVRVFDVLEDPQEAEPLRDIAVSSPFYGLPWGEGGGAGLRLR